jgi:hypothetical protein
LPTIPFDEDHAYIPAELAKLKGSPASTGESFEESKLNSADRLILGAAVSQNGCSPIPFLGFSRFSFSSVRSSGSSVCAFQLATKRENSTSGTLSPSGSAPAKYLALGGVKLEEKNREGVVMKDGDEPQGAIADPCLLRVQ